MAETAINTQAGAYLHPGWQEHLDALRGFRKRVAVRCRSLEREQVLWQESAAEPGGSAREVEMCRHRAAQAAFARKMLLQVVADLLVAGPEGAGRVYTVEEAGRPHATSVLCAACMLGDYAMARLLVRLGADPDAGDTPPLAVVLGAAQPEEAELQPGVEGRLAFCDWLVSHGATVGTGVRWEMFAMVSLLNSDGDPWAALWLLQHGFPAQSPNGVAGGLFPTLLGFHGAAPVLEKALREGLLDARRGAESWLGCVLVSMGSPMVAQEECDLPEQVHLLLETGVPVEPGAEAALQELIRRSPSALAATRCRQVLELLRTSG